ncbi:MAG: RHS repeat-associated core domain-containing protein [Chloroflexi bacterium]|nr:RHS repeat-associated core domain-containing protein [Chloroflexota bacterium]
MPTDKLFTWQRLESTGLYYYGARYYDPTIGRFISADTVVQNQANPQSMNRYSYVFNNPLRYVDPTGLWVEFENELEVLAMLEAMAEYGMDYAAGSLMEAMVMDYFEDIAKWEELRQQQQKYTQYMIDSDIQFDIVDIELPTQTISFLTDMPGLPSFDEPVQLRLISQGESLEIMKTLKTGGMSLYPDPILLRTDQEFKSAKVFDNYVAHEVYHRSEQALWANLAEARFEDNKYADWYGPYMWEMLLPHDWRPSEIRANNYANRHFPKK